VAAGLGAAAARLVRSARRRPAWAAGPVVPEALFFLDPIDQICEEPTPGVLRATHILVAALFVSLLLIGALARIDVVVSATGRLTTETAPIVLQPMERAILRELRVKPGDAVTRGEVLATLDPTFARADQAVLEGQLRTVRGQLRRLEAEEAGTALAPTGDTDPDEALQLTVHREREAEYRSRLRTYDEELERLGANLRTVEDNAAALARQVAVGRAIEAMRQTLLTHQNGSRLQYLDALAARMATERELTETADQLPELRHGLRSKAAERQGFVDAWHRETAEALVAARTQLGTLTQSLAKSSRLNDLVVVTAPEDGVVLDVAPRSGGSVLREAEPLVTITPSHAALIAEVMIGSRDVGYVQPGADAVVKIDAFPYQRHGVLKGHVLSVGEESFPLGGGGEAVHRGRIALVDTRLERMPADSRLFPGLTLTAEVKVGSRSALSFLFAPITRAFQESLREP
jgi:HlyD family secretion protein